MRPACSEKARIRRHSGVRTTKAKIAMRKSASPNPQEIAKVIAEGCLSLMNALRQAEAVPHLPTTWYIPTFVVPILLVTHGMIFARPIRHARQPSAEPIESPAACWGREHFIQEDNPEAIGRGIVDWHRRLKN